MKKLLVPLLVVAVVVMAGLLYMKQDKTQLSTNNEQQEVFDPKNPNFFLGEVVLASDNSIEVKTGQNTYTLAIRSDVKLVKQVVNDGTTSVVEATLTDFTPKSTIVAHFPISEGFDSNTPNGSTIYPEKIQIIVQQ